MVLDSQGAQAKMCMEPGVSPHTFDTSSEPYEFESESMTGEETHIGNDDGIRGTRSEHSIRTRIDERRALGQVVMYPSPNDLNLLLPRILGANESTDVFALAETLQAFGLMIDTVAKVWSWSDCYINKAIFSGSPGQKIKLVLDIIAFDFAEGNAGTFPALTLGVTSADQPYTFSDLAFTLAGSARTTKSFELTIDNFLEPRRSNSVTITSLTPQRRLISLKTVHPYTSGETDLASQALYGAAGSIVMTPIGGGMSGVSTSFAFGTLQCPKNRPPVGGKKAIDLTLNMVARMTGSTRELVVTHDPVAA